MAAITYAGDTLDGHPPATRPRPNSGFILGILAVVAAVLAVAAVWVRTRPGLVVDVLGLGALTYGVALTWGPGPAWVVAGVSVLLAHQFADGTAPDQG